MEDDWLRLDFRCHTLVAIWRAHTCALVANGRHVEDTETDCCVTVLLHHGLHSSCPALTCALYLGVLSHRITLQLVCTTSKYDFEVLNTNLTQCHKVTRSTSPANTRCWHSRTPRHGTSNDRPEHRHTRARIQEHVQPGVGLRTRYSHARMLHYGNARTNFRLTILSATF